MFGDLLDLDFGIGGWGGDLDWDAIIGALSEMELGDVGELFLDTETGQIVDAATAAAGEFDPALIGPEAGQGMDFSDADFVDEPTSPLGMSTSDQLRTLEAEGKEGDLWREQMDPFTGLTAEMPSGFDWGKLLRAAGSGLSGLSQLLGAGNGPLAGLGGAGRAPSISAFGSPDASVPSVGGMGGASIPSVASPMSAMGVDRPGLAGGGGLYGEASVGGLGGTPSSYVRDPITGLPVPVTPQTPPGMQPLQLNPFQPLIIPSSGGGQIPMAMQPAPRLSGLQRLLMESRG